MFLWLSQHKIAAFSMLLLYLTLLNIIVFDTPLQIFFAPQQPAVEKLEYLASDVNELDRLPD